MLPNFRENIFYELPISQHTLRCNSLKDLRLVTKSSYIPISQIFTSSNFSCAHLDIYIGTCLIMPINTQTNTLDVSNSQRRLLPSTNLKSIWSNNYSRSGDTHKQQRWWQNNWRYINNLFLPFAWSKTRSIFMKLNFTKPVSNVYFAFTKWTKSTCSYMRKRNCKNHGSRQLTAPAAGCSDSSPFSLLQ